MSGSNAKANQLPRVQEFYNGKSVFLTGVTGFVGSVLLEILLRCCPGIKSIYTLIRRKKNLLPLDRKEQIFNKKVFEKLKKQTPDLLGKVRIISGDVTLPNLGMDKDDMHLLIEEVSIVFHCAGVLSFTKPLEFLLKNNVLSLSHIIKLCRKMRKFEVLVYTSTAYSNCNHQDFPLKEEVYRLPFHSEVFLDALKNDEKDKLEELIAHCKPDWPNFYCFSKCLAENVIMDTASDIAVAIIRPSVVIGTWKHPIPGYVEENSGIMTISLGVGKGFIKVINADPNNKLNLVPADIVANAHILAAWCKGLKRCESPLVFNCTATENLQVKLCKYMETLKQLVDEFPLPRSFLLPTNPNLIPCKYLYCVMATYHHYLPAVVLGLWLRIFEEKPRLVSSYRFLEMVMSQLNFFWFHSFEFERKNFEFLNKLIYTEEGQDLSLNFSDATILKMISSLPKGSSFYEWKTDKKSQSERKRIINIRYIQTSSIQGVFLVACCLTIYWMFSFIFL